MSEAYQGRKRIGRVISGGLRENLNVRLDVSGEEIQEGAFIVIQGREWDFHGLITDIRLEASDPRYAGDQSEGRIPPHLSTLVNRHTLFTELEVLPALMTAQPPLGEDEREQWYAEIEAGERDEPRPLPIKTIPAQKSPVYLAAQQDIALIFGDPDKQGHFTIGETREQGHPIALNLEKFVKRSSGIFGATGTGKSFLTRLLLAGLIDEKSASVLVLDMHNEYGFDDVDEDEKQVRGLKSLFGAKVQVVALGAGSTIRENVPDFHLELAVGDIRPADIELLRRELNLRETTAGTLDRLVTSFGADKWFEKFMALEHESRRGEDGELVGDSVEAWAVEAGVNVMAAKGLHSKLQRVFDRDYIKAEPAADGVRQIIESLEAGRHVVLSFGRHDSDLDYLLVSNLLTRRIRQVWEQRTNAHRSKGEAKPNNLIIAVEEAHKLLNREMAAQTTFSTIARELRKYYVTLLIIDQRPSQIYDEVMSQLGTRVSGWLGDDEDIRAVLSGLSGRDSLRGMLARLQPKEEVLLLGWGVPMPLPVRSRRYDEAFWNEVGRKPRAKGKTSEKELKSDLGL
jgi:hypothetical protein